MTTHTQPSESPMGRSRIGNGRELLPGIDGRSIWARLFRDERGALIDHAGGENYVTEPQRMIARRAACLEAELIHLEASFAATRAEGGTPDPADLDLYGRLANSQRRFVELLGLTRARRDVTPDLSTYLSRKEATA